MARQGTETTETTEASANTPEPTVADLSCRNRQSIFMNDAQAPPCTHHPSGTLKYIWHGAYDHLLAGSGNRKNTYVVLVGDAIAAHYGSLCNFVTDEFSKNRNIWLGLDLESEAATTPNGALRGRIIEHVGKLRKDQSWHQKDDELFIELALSVFIRDSHHHWMKRSEQSRVDQLDDARSTAKSDMQPGSHSRRAGSREGASKRRRLFQDTQTHLRPSRSIQEGATLASAIDIDDQDELDELRHRREFSGSDVLSQAHNEKKTAQPAVALTSPPAPTTSSTPTWLLQNLITKLETENRHLRSENASLSSRTIAAQTEAARLRHQLDQLQAESDDLLADNAELGVVLAQKVGIRRNSAAAVRTDMAARTALTRDVTGRLLENEGFVGRWFRGR